MFERDHRIYYERRRAQATELGDRATDPKIAAIHYELALRYAIASAGGSAKENVVPIRKERAAHSSEPPRAMFGVTVELDTRQAPEVATALRHCHGASLT